MVWMIVLVAAVVVLLATSNREQVLIAFDQLLNARLGGWADETFSARCWRNRRYPKYACWVKVINGLFFWQANHCLSAYNSELNRRHLPIEYRHSLKSEK